jgi:RNA polymerase sigma-70 factor (family 1)
MDLQRQIDSYKDYNKLFHLGNEEGFNHFFQLLYPSLCSFANSLVKDIEVAKDIASHAFMKTWEKHEKLYSAGEIKAYVYQAVRNDCYKWLEKEQRKAIALRNIARTSARAADSHLELMIKTELYAQLHQLIKQMPRAQQTVFRKLYIEGKTAREASEELQVAISTVKNHKARGLLWLKDKFSVPST